LIQRARRENAIAIVSIFVNPLQFAPTEDFQQYPRSLDRDRQLCEQAGVDLLFVPTPEEMGMGHGHSLTQVLPPESMTSVLCGRYRPGHFPGVATMVAKLLNLVQPTRAYFGQKDAQQVAIVRQLVADLNLPVQIVACPIVREASGLACSSRNQYLTAAQQEQAAPVLYRALKVAETAFQGGERLASSLVEIVKTELATVPGMQLQYVELVHPDTLIPLEKVDAAGLLAIAVRLGSTRLIDNMILRKRQPIVAIDGPAGAGKSTVARQVAQALGLVYLDTGAMYRAITWLVLESGILIDDEPAIAELVSQSPVQLMAGNSPDLPLRVWIDEQDVTQAIRSLAVTSQVSAIAAQPAVRRELLKQQQRWGQKGGVVAEGRDIGTHVFPDAELKIFLTASVSERARRRHQELETGTSSSPIPSLEEMEQAIAQRDTRDSTRALAPLQKADDAIEISTDNLSIDQVTNQIISLYNQKSSVAMLGVRKEPKV
jgi:pantoate ligase/cytidylate kinase